MQAFKFTKRKFVDAASFRFGTLYDFRREEKYGTAVGDGNEGASKSVWELFHYWNDFDPLTLLGSQPFECCYAKGQENEGLKRHVLNVTSQDLLVFCVTEEFNENLFSVFDSDVCLAIKDWKGFSRALVESLSVPVEKFLCGICSYSEKDFFAASRSLPSLPFWKEERYSVQKELRLCVSIAMDPIEPVTTTCPKAMDFCEIIERRV